MGLNKAIFDKLPCTTVSQIPQQTFEDFPHVVSKYEHRPRFIQLALIAAREAYKNAGLLHDETRFDEKTGVSIGVGMSSLQILSSSIRLIDDDRGRRLSPYTVSQSDIKVHYLRSKDHHCRSLIYWLIWPVLWSVSI